jgi:hypothetical protein
MRWRWCLGLMTTALAVVLALNCAGIRNGAPGDARAEHTDAAVSQSGNWRSLSQPHPIGPITGAVYYSFAMPNGSQAHLIVVDYKHQHWTLHPVLSEPSTSTTSTLAKSFAAPAAVNGGYFNLKDGGQSTSYVLLNGKVVADPMLNVALLSNPMLKPFIKRICNRSEVRFLKDRKGRPLIDIVRHDTPLAPGTRLVDSLQAGPQLLPTVEAIDEAFVRTNPDGKDTDAISALKEAARTAFGITNDGYAMMLCVAGKGQDPESSGINLEDLAALMRRLGCVQALNFDGGASTTMYVQLGADPASGTVVCGKKPETLVKSALVLQPSK